MNKICTCFLVVFVIIFTEGCAFTAKETFINKTSLPIEYSNDNIYFYRKNNDEYAIIQYDCQSGEEKEITHTTNFSYMDLYDDSIYYTESNTYDVYSINIKSLRKHQVMTPKHDPVSNSEYKQTKSFFLYDYYGALGIQKGKLYYEIENTIDYYVYKGDIYYVDYKAQEVKKLNDDFQSKESIMRLSDIQSEIYTWWSDSDEIIELSAISIKNDVLYFLVGVSGIRSLYSYDLNTHQIQNVLSCFVNEYQILGNTIYYTERDVNERKIVLKSYNMATKYENNFVEGVKSFRIAENKLIYSLPKDDTLYVLNLLNNEIIEIYNVVT